jgi:hypothetical protein
MYWDEERGEYRLSRAERLQRVMERVEKELLEGGPLKVTVGDWVRLAQMEKEEGEQQPREVEVKWVDDSDPDNSFRG